MTRGASAGLLILAFAMVGCATTYQPSSLTGGYSEEQISPGVWHLYYGGNGYTTSETVQTFWLYRAAELTLAQGYDGFEILVPANVDAYGPRSDLPIPMHLDGTQKPSLSGNIRMVRKPFTARPPVLFDAAALKAALEPRAKGALCQGNVCPHVHAYLMPALP
jgi:hypothetical protein